MTKTKNLAAKNAKKMVKLVAKTKKQQTQNLLKRKNNFLPDYKKPASEKMAGFFVT